MGRYKTELLSAVLILGLIGLVSVSAKSVQHPPATKGSEVIGPAPDFNCTRNGAHAHETDCLLFYDCWEGDAVLFTCTEQMLFDTRYAGCNFAAQVDCGHLIRPTNVPSTVTPPSNVSTTTGVTRPPPPGDFECPEAGGAFPHAEYCEYYWTCWDWEPRLELCQFDYLFDLVYMGCNFPDQTDCGDRTRPPGSTNPTTRPTTTSRPVTTTRPVTDVTEEPGTGAPPSSTTTRRTTTGSPGDFVCPEGDGNFVDPNHCSGFYSCLNHEIIGHQCCPDGLFFNERINNCDFPWNVDCPHPDLPPCQL